MTRTRRVHPAWFVAVVAFVALVGAAGFRATPGPGWRAASLTVAGTALAVVPLVLWRLRDHPAELGVTAYGASSAQPPPEPLTRGRRPAGRQRARVRRADPSLLAVGRRVRHLRSEHQRPGRHPFQGSARSS